MILLARTKKNYRIVYSIIQFYNRILLLETNISQTRNDGLIHSSHCFLVCKHLLTNHCLASDFVSSIDAHVLLYHARDHLFHDLFHDLLCQKMPCVRNRGRPERSPEEAGLSDKSRCAL